MVLEEIVSYLCRHHFWLNKKPKEAEFYCSFWLLHLRSLRDEGRSMNMVFSVLFFLLLYQSKKIQSFHYLAKYTRRSLGCFRASYLFLSKRFLPARNLIIRDVASFLHGNYWIFILVTGLTIDFVLPLMTILQYKF